MSQNWMRHFELQLLDKDGRGIDLSDFKVSFKIDWFNISSATRIATFTIYNLSKDTVQRILQEEFSRVRIIAGYDGVAPVVSQSQVGVARNVTSADATGQSGNENFGLIFSGDIRYSMTGRENPTDTYVLIQAADSDSAFISAMSGSTLSAGYTVTDMNKALMKDFSPYGVAEDNSQVTMPATVFPRGRVLFGMTRDLMDNVANQCRGTWMMVNGVRVMTNSVPDESLAIELNSSTGLIGMPQQTIGQGVNVRCLINPNIHVNSLIRLNQADVLINQATIPEGDLRLSNGPFSATVANGNSTINLPVSQSNTASLATDGVYIVRGIMYTGETRGQAWYMDMMCAARDAADLTSQSAREKGL